MINSEGHLDAVRTELAAEEDGRSVVDQHIQALVAGFEISRQLTHVRLHREIGQQVVHI